MAVDPVRVKSLFLAAAELDDPAARSAYLDQQCGGDVELRHRVDQLLNADVPPGADATATVDPPAELQEDDATLTMPPSAEPAAGQVLAGRYRLTECIGEGGMGSVWVAQQSEPVKRRVAVKLIKAGMDSRQVLARFDAERQALALMDHPNIAKVLDGGLHDHRPFFVMELVKGVPITQYCDANKLNPRQRLELFVPVCHAIQHAHQKGIIHRDIKPSNVLVALYDDRPVPKVIDFGVAKATGATLTEQTIETAFGGVVGTPQYMSPEQASLNNLDIDTRSDVYSLGVLLYELLTGSPPFSKKDLERKGLLEMLRVVREEEPPRPSVKLSTADALPSLSANRGTEPKKLTGLLRSDLDWIVMRALEKDRSRRYETASGFASDVLRYLGGEPVIAHPPSASYRMKKFVRRNRPQVIAAGLVVLTLVLGILGTTAGMIEARRQQRAATLAQQAERERAEGERQAKELAEANERRANDAARAERVARQKEERERAFAQAIADFVKNDFLALTSVDGQHRFGDADEVGLNKDTTARELLVRAATKLDNRKNLDPLIEAELRWMIGVNLRGVGDYPRSIAFLERCVALRTQHLGRGHVESILALNSLGVAQGSAERNSQAEQTFQEALQLARQHLPPDHPATIGCLENLAGSLRLSGKLDQALSLGEEAYRLSREQFGPDNLVTLISMCNLATSLREKGKIDQALNMYQEALKRIQSTQGPDSPWTLGAIANLGETYYFAKQYSEAIKLLEDAINRQDKILGANHPQTIRPQIVLGASYVATKRLDRGLPILENAMQLAKAKLGAESLPTLSAMAFLADGYRQQGRFDLARSMLVDVYHVRQRTLGAENLETLQAGQNLATCYWYLKSLDQSIPLFEETLRGRTKLLGKDHPTTQTTAANLAVNYKDADRLNEAVPLLEAAFQASKKNPALRWVAPHLVEAYARIGKPKEAVAVLPAMLAHMRGALPPNSPPLAAALANTALTLLKARAFPEAEKIAREALAIRERFQPKGFTTYNTHSILGGALLGQQQYAEAEPLLVKGFEGMAKAIEQSPPPKDALPQVHMRLAEALDRLIELFTATNKPEQVKKYQELRAKLPQPVASPAK